MHVYLTVMFICCILMYATRNADNKVTPLAISFGLIWAMISLQQGWGGDFESYFLQYDLIRGLSFREILLDESHGEIGYKLFMSIMPTYQVGFAIAMAIWCFSVAFFFYHFVPQKWWFFAILFVFWDRPIMMGMISSFPRMAIANSFLIFAMYLVKIKKERLGFLLLVPAFFFHKSVVFLFIMLLLPDKPIRGLSRGFVIALLLLVLVSWAAPSVFVSFSQSLISDIEVLSDYSTYFEYAQSFKMRGLSLIVLCYWIYLLISSGVKQGFSNVHYLLLYCALVRILFNMMPDLGMSVRFYYFIDLYFFAGMMCVMDKLPKGDVNRLGLALTLIFMFWFLGFRKYSLDPFFRDHWDFYNFIF